MIAPRDAPAASHLPAPVRAIVGDGSRPALDIAVDLALLLARAGASERRVLWMAALPWLPAAIEIMTCEPPELGAGQLVNAFGAPIAGGRYPVDLAREVLDLRDGDPLLLVRQRRHPARSLRGAIRYMDVLWRLRYRLARHACRAAPPAVMPEHATA